MNSKYFQSSDLYEVALLFASGFRLIDTVREGERIHFVFDQKEACEMTIKQYFSNELTIKVRDYVEGLRTVKNYIFRR
jgi:hypothetical protein